MADHSVLANAIGFVVLITPFFVFGGIWAYKRELAKEKVRKEERDKAMKEWEERAVESMKKVKGRRTV